MPLARTLAAGSDQLVVPVLRPVSHKQRGVLTVRLAWTPKPPAASQPLPALVSTIGDREHEEKPTVLADGPASIDAPDGAPPLCTIPEHDDTDGSTCSCSNSTAAIGYEPGSVCQATAAGPLEAGAAASAGAGAGKGEKAGGSKDAAASRFPHEKPPLSLSPSHGYIRRTMQRLRASVAGRS